MNKEIIKEYLLDWQERELKNIKNREIELKESQKIQTIIGARRTGKTYLLYRHILDLEKAGVKRKNIVYLNFENPTLSEITYKEIKEIINIHWSLFPEIINEKLYLFIDEPQAIANWELAIRDIYDNFSVWIFLTGSSSRLLSKEIATSLRGRSVATVLLPLSFSEYLHFKDFTFNKKMISSKTKALLLNHFEKFLAFGAYPETVLSGDNDEKIKILKDYFDLTVYRDIVDRFNIKNTALIRTLIDALIASCAREFSINKYYLSLKSHGLKVGKNTLYEYLSILEDAFFIFPLKRFSYSKKTEDLTIPKIYFGDVGFLNLYSLENFGQRLENLVFLHLYRRTANNPLLKINYWKSKTGKEVDFVLSAGRKIKEIYQVSYMLNDKATERREIENILAALSEFNLKTGYIITDNRQEERKISGKIIKIVPAYKFFLELR